MADTVAAFASGNALAPSPLPGAEEVLSAALLREVTDGANQVSPPEDDLSCQIRPQAPPPPSASQK